ncbi:MAG: asparagine--tRNA ligase [Clostridiales bacterium]|jgi:asparaginyl-tRNA synthetase|nr:asparagine--tRNA ligase [Clostridiales bacterium]
MKKTTVKELFGKTDLKDGEVVLISGWVRSLRASKTFGFIELNDGSFLKNCQIVFDGNTACGFADGVNNKKTYSDGGKENRTADQKVGADFETISKQCVGAALSVAGRVVLTPQNRRPFEIAATEIVVEGNSVPEYPIQKKKHSFEFLREKAHLRPRTNTFGAVFRIRSETAFAIHKFFHERGFVYVHTPIITASDCEGAGAMFKVTTLDLNDIPRRKAEKPKNEKDLNIISECGIANAKGETNTNDISKCGIAKCEKDLNCISERGKANAKSETNTNDISKRGKADVKCETNTNDISKRGKADGKNETNTNDISKRGIANAKNETNTNAISENETADAKCEKGEIDFGSDFFGKAAKLTVSGQLNVETFAMAFAKVYTFGPTFRAELSNTARHAAEFWMVEPEIAFSDLADDMNLAEDMVKFIINHIEKNCPEELDFLNQNVDGGLKERLKNIAESEFVRLSYTEAVEILKKSGKKFEYPVEWGSDLQSEHERFLTEEVFKKPVFLTDYPKGIKAFYMRLNDDGKTVAAADLLVAGIGELIGGSRREERAEVLNARMKEFGLCAADYKWYTDLRIYGGCKHAGFGLGFERMIMLLTGMTNIRDVSAFPRTYNNLSY